MQMLNFIKQFWNKKSPVINSEALSIVPEEIVTNIKDDKPYAFNEFEIFFLEAVKSERYESLDKMLEKGFKINKELRHELYGLFWVDYTYMTREGDSKLTKKRSFDDGKFENFIKFMVKHHLFEVDFFDVITEGNIQLTDESKEVYQAFKKSLKNNSKIIKLHNLTIEDDRIGRLKKLTKINIDELENVRNFNKLNMYEQKMASEISDNFLDLMKHHYAITGIGTDYQHFLLSNKEANIYKKSIVFSKVFSDDMVDGAYLNDESLNNFNILKSPLLHVPFIDFLNKETFERVSFKDFNLELFSNFIRKCSRDYRLGFTDDYEQYGELASHLHALGVHKKEMITSLFFPFLIKSMVEQKGISPVDLFRDIINRDGCISDLAITIFQSYPLEIVGSMNKIDGLKLVKKLDILISEIDISNNYDLNSEKKSRERRFIKEHLQKDLNKLVDYLYKKDEEEILQRLDIHNAHDIEKMGDFVGYAKIKQLPVIIIEKLEFISGRLEILKKSDLDIENKLFVEKSSSEIFKILNAYIDLEELSSEMSDIENVLINPLVNIDNALDVIFKNYQESKMRELSIKKKTARFS